MCARVCREWLTPGRQRDRWSRTRQSLFRTVEVDPCRTGIRPCSKEMGLPNTCIAGLVCARQQPQRRPTVLRPRAHRQSSLQGYDDHRAVAAAKHRGTVWGGKHRWLRVRRGEVRAHVGIACKTLVAAFNFLATDTNYFELGPLIRPRGRRAHHPTDGARYDIGIGLKGTLTDAQWTSRDPHKFSLPL